MDKEEIYNKWVTNKAPKELKYCVLEAMYEYSDTVNKSLLDKIIDQDKELIAYRSLLDDAAVRVAELESDLQIAKYKVTLNYQDATHFENKVKELEKENKWVRVSEALPEKFKNALVLTNKNQIGISCVDASGEMDNFICEVTGDEIITHWMPLPKPIK